MFFHHNFVSFEMYIGVWECVEYRYREIGCCCIELFCTSVDGNKYTVKFMTSGKNKGTDETDKQYLLLHTSPIQIFGVPIYVIIPLL